MPNIGGQTHCAGVGLDSRRRRSYRPRRRSDCHPCSNKEAHCTPNCLCARRDTPNEKRRRRNAPAKTVVVGLVIWLFVVVMIGIVLVVVTVIDHRVKPMGPLDTYIALCKQRGPAL